MNLYDALTQIAQAYDLNPEDLQNFAVMDTVGGYHSDQTLARWTIGSIWHVEGQILYALIRAIKPRFIVNLGVFHGCSTAHIMAAVTAIQTDDPKYKPTVVAVDLYRPQSIPDGVEFIGMDAQQYVEEVMPVKKVDLLFEDLDHSSDSVRRVWTAFQDKAKKGAFILSHDAVHHIVGTDVRFGILTSGVTNPLVLAVEPSDCGLATWRKP